MGNSNNAQVLGKARAEIARCLASQKIETGDLSGNQCFSTKANSRSSVPDKRQSRYTTNDIKHMLATADAVDDFLRRFAPPMLDPFCGGR